MAMNNADFLSDAVALDLGKSGVKVAETLEIQVGEEWWRLISATESVSAMAFSNRISRSAQIVGEALDVSSLTSNFRHLGNGWIEDKTNNVCITVALLKQTGASDIPAVILAYRSGSITTNAAIQGFDGTVLKSYSPITYGNTAINWNLVWDYVNQTGIYFTKPQASGVNWVYYFSISGTAVQYADYIRSNVYPSISAEYKSFVECPEKIYTLFKGSGALSVKFTVPTVGQSPYSLAGSIVTTTGAVTLPVGSNYRTEQAFLFYSRTHESVGVAWVDNTNGRLYYAVESDGWATAYELLSFNVSSDGSVITSFGNLVLGGSVGGEYYVAGRTNRKTGNIGRPAGFSFPTNTEVLGVANSVAGQVRLFARVGSTVYVYGIQLDTMEIVTQSSINAGVSFSTTFEPVKFAESATRELYVLAECGHAYDDSCKSFLICVNKENGAIVWIWGADSTGWYNSTLWPLTYALSGSTMRSRFNFVRKYKDEIVFLALKIYYNTSTGSDSIRLEHRFVKVTDILACNSVSDVNAVLADYTRNAVTFTGYANWPLLSYGFVSTQPKNILTWGETVDTIFFADYSNPDSAGANVLHFNKTTRAYHSSYKWSNGYASRYMQMCPTVRVPNFYGYSYNIDEADVPGITGRVVGVEIAARRVIYYNPTLATRTTHNLWSNMSTSRFVNIFTTGIDNIVYAILHHPTSSAVEAIMLKTDAPSSLYSVFLNLPHAAFRVLAEEEKDILLFVGNQSGGEIPYTRYKGYSIDQDSALAVNSTNFEKVYTIDTGINLVGGARTTQFCGSWAILSDYINKMSVIDTGVKLTDFAGGAVPTESGAIIYKYQETQFTPYPFAREGIRAELSNISKTTKITLPETQDNLIRGMLAAGTDFRGSRCILRRVFPDHLDEAGADIVLLDGYIQDWSYVPGKKGIAFSVSKTLIDVGAQFPKRLMNMGCSHVFKGSRCRYLGEEGRCLKTRAFCTSLGNLNQFGGFPWVAARQRRVMWK